MDERYQHLIHYIRNAAHELTASAAVIIRGAVSKVTSIKFRFIGDAYSNGPISINNGTDKTVQMPLTVDPTKHNHTVNTLARTSMYGDGTESTSNTVVLRTQSNEIYATGAGLKKVNNPESGEDEYTVDTGYKLSDGKDISNLFMRAGTSNFTAETIDVNASGNNAIVSMSLTKDGNKFILTNNWGWVCNCGEYLYCRCCD